MIDISFLRENIMSPILHQKIFSGLIGLAVAAVIIALGYMIAKILGITTKKILYKIGFDKYFIDHNLDQSIGKASASSVVGEIVKWYVWVLFMIPAIDILQLGEISILLLDFVKWIPSLILGSVIVIAGLIASDFCARKIKNLTFGLKNQVALGVKLIILFFFLDVALVEVGLNITLIENTFLIILGGVVLALSIAIGLGLGFALKDHGKEIIDGIKKDIEKSNNS
ncbi:MAG: hypothetical protein DRN66_02150 [Candidatus Nanohalarchaeota archaeon]|nr:MAG: hypothetical protein DRN66_02150 [Candidatus Nanohaloarchaeota archaeon]